jgi:hypothetical protein
MWGATARPSYGCVSGPDPQDAWRHRWRPMTETLEWREALFRRAERPTTPPWIAGMEQQTLMNHRSQVTAGFPCGRVWSGVSALAELCLRVGRHSLDCPRRLPPATDARRPTLASDGLGGRRRPAFASRCRARSGALEHLSDIVYDQTATGEGFALDREDEAAMTLAGLVATPDQGLSRPWAQRTLSRSLEVGQDAGLGE